MVSVSLPGPSVSELKLVGKRKIAEVSEFSFQKSTGTFHNMET